MGEEDSLIGSKDREDEMRYVNKRGFENSGVWYV